MKKVNLEFVQHAFAGNRTLVEYISATIKIGLWESEKIIYNKYLKKDNNIIDIGCGTGRATFGLFNQGFKNIVGLDISKEMLDEARIIGEEKGIPIKFYLGDATNLQFEDESFDSALFTYNGLMQIPCLENRMRVFHEINRIIKKDGIFIFTTHDMEIDKEHSYYWKKEEKLWNEGKQNPRLLEFGDLIYKLYDREMYIHVPRREEILNCIKESGFELLEDIYRPEIYKESETVKLYSDECRFWIIRK